MTPKGLLTVFDCPHPCGSARITHRACLLRQRGKKRVRIKTTEGMVVRVVPVDTHCAEKCEVGRRVARRFPGVTLGTEEQRPRSYGTIHFGRRRPVPTRT